MATKLIYDKGFSEGHITGKHDKSIKDLIISFLPNNTAFVNTTWIEIDEDLEKILNKRPKKIICYSSVDWENTVCRREVHEFIKSKAQNTIYIGNTNNRNYFSFWMDFVFEHYKKFEKFDTFDIRDSLKTYMCLNRKPHSHRIELVEQLFKNNLQNHGYISLGKFEKPVPWDYRGLDVPIKLDTDIENFEGDEAVAGTSGGITNDITGLGCENNWNSHFLHIVSETTVHTDVFISEKTFKPIIGMRPFLVLGDDKVYDKLHEWGFDTFDDIFGTGYKGRYHTDRIPWIVSVIEEIHKEKQLSKLLFKLKPRLSENRKLFFHIAEANRQKIQKLEL